METKVITMASHEFGTVRKIKENGNTLYCGSDVAKALGYANARKALSDHCRYVTKRDTPHPQSKNKTIEMSFIPEGDVWRLICHSKLPNAEQFEKWIFDDVVPTVVKTGKYEIPKQPEQLTLETSEYFYFDKTYNGNPVLTLKDIEHFTGIAAHKAQYFLKNNTEKHIDYIIIEGPWLIKYKAENPNVSKLASATFVVTKKGFIKLMEYFGCKAETPKCFIENKKELTIDDRIRISDDSWEKAAKNISWLLHRFENVVELLSLPKGSLMHSNDLHNYKVLVEQELDILSNSCEMHLSKLKTTA